MATALSRGSRLRVEVPEVGGVSVIGLWRRGWRSPIGFARSVRVAAVASAVSSAVSSSSPVRALIAPAVAAVVRWRPPVVALPALVDGRSAVDAVRLPAPVAAVPVPVPAVAVAAIPRAGAAAAAAAAMAVAVTAPRTAAAAAAAAIAARGLTTASSGVRAWRRRVRRRWVGLVPRRRRCVGGAERGDVARRVADVARHRRTRAVLSATAAAGLVAAAAAAAASSSVGPGGFVGDLHAHDLAADLCAVQRARGLLGVARVAELHELMGEEAAAPAAEPSGSQRRGGDRDGDGDG